MSLEKLKNRRNALLEQKQREKEKNDNRKVRRSALHKASVNVQADPDGGDTSAIDQELRGLDADDIEYERGKKTTDEALEELRKKIAAALESEEAERIAGLKSNISRNAAAAKKHCDPIEKPIKETASDIIQLCYQNGIMDTALLDGLFQFPDWLNGFLWAEVNKIFAGIIAGTIAQPKRHVPQEIRVVHPRTVRDVESDLRSATNRLSGITANLHTMRVNLDDLRGKEKEELQTSIEADEKILADVRNQITGLDEELKIFTDRE